MQPHFIKFDPYNFVPVTRTPWAGRLVADTKAKGLEAPPGGWPERVGESWEVSTDASFPSRISQLKNPAGEPQLFTELLHTSGFHFLGEAIAQQFGSHCPLLLKWLSARDPLSVQVHPNHDHPLLKENECGKPESWLVMDTDMGGHVFLGFKEGLSKEEIITALRNDRARDVMHMVFPLAGDYISIPTGCVHATGPGVLIAEPQYVLPEKSGKTWRLSDWGRRYNERGEEDANGKPRELHVEEALSAIDWQLPRGKELENLLIISMNHKDIFTGNKNNPFPIQYFASAGIYTYKPLVPGQFSLVTCWKGQLQLVSKNGHTREHLVLNTGESGLVSAAAGEIEIVLAEPQPFIRPEAAFFAFVPPQSLAGQGD
ncbi:hypothetical protein EBU99_04685 [bacterium]|nr:hypothetical protein [bacterium]